jgi:hypothetical protein
MRVLLAWELGANSGHRMRLLALAERLVARGHRVDCVVQDLKGFAQVPLVSERRIGLWQAPVWGGLLAYGGRQSLGAPQGFGDVLANLGLQSASEIEGLLRAWDGLYRLLQPDLVLADFAPAALLAARGRVARVAIGTGFTLPPSTGPRFPRFGPAAPLVAEDALLALVNHALGRLGQAGLTHLPQIMAADLALPATFACLDPYPAPRLRLPPFFPAEALEVTPEGAGVFAYLPQPGRGDLEALGTLAKHHRIRAHLPGFRGQIQGVTLSPALNWREIARDHWAVICQGGMGMVSAALAAGMGLAVWPGGIEQELTARALQREGLAGRDLPPEGQAALARREAFRLGRAELAVEAALAAHFGKIF